MHQSGSIIHKKHMTNKQRGIQATKKTTSFTPSVPRDRPYRLRRSDRQKCVPWDRPYRLRRSGRLKSGFRMPPRRQSQSVSQSVSQSASQPVSQSVSQSAARHRITPGYAGKKLWLGPSWCCIFFLKGLEGHSKTR